MPNEAPEDSLQTRPPTLTATTGGGVRVDTVTATPADGAVYFPAIPGITFRKILGEGGQSIVFEVKTEVGQVVALKLLKAYADDRDSRDRFRQEAEVIARLKHRNVVTLLGWGEYGGYPYFTMPIYTGGTLARQLAYFHEDPARAVAVIAKVADAVQYLHSRGAVHRDLKPHNVLLDEEREPYLSDFGLLKLVGGGAIDFSVTPPDASLEGEVRGTPAYMDPQAAAGKTRAVGRPWDIWGLGVMLFELLTGQRPFSAADPDALLHIVRTQDPPQPRSLKPDLDPDLERIVLKCLARDPADRYATAGQLAEELRRWLTRRSTERLRRRRRALIAAGLALLGVIIVAVLLLKPSTPSTREEQLAEARKRLAKGESVQLIGEKGPPLQPYRVRVGQERAHFPPLEDGTFTVETQGASLIELFDDPGTDDWRFRVQVRQNSVNQVDQMGIYSGHQSFATPGGECHYFVRFAFNEFGNINPLGKPEGCWNGSLPFFRQQPGRNLRAMGWQLLGAVGRFAPEVSKPDQSWRTLEIRASAVSLEAYFDDRHAFTLPRPLDKDVATTLQTYHEMPDPLPIDLGPRAGIGLYLEVGSASFRNALIEPNPR